MKTNLELSHELYRNLEVELATNFDFWTPLMKHLIRLQERLEYDFLKDTENFFLPDGTPHPIIDLFFESSRGFSMQDYMPIESVIVLLDRLVLEENFKHLRSKGNLERITIMIHKIASIGMDKQAKVYIEKIKNILISELKKLDGGPGLGSFVCGFLDLIDNKNIYPTLEKTQSEWLLEIHKVAPRYIGEYDLIHYFRKSELSVKEALAFLAES